MVSTKELAARVKDFLRFSRQERLSLIAAILVTALIFSFRDWGEESFNLIIGMKNLFLLIIIAALTFFFRLACQKTYALSHGYKAEFKLWWLGLGIAAVIGFLSLGRLPLVLIGTVVASFMVRQRLGEFRYGFSHKENALIASWGIFGNLILAVFFAVGVLVFPQSYLFNKGLILNLIMALCSLIPLPQLDGLQIYFGSRALYFIILFSVALTTVLLLTKTKIGLIIAVVLGALVGILAILISSEV
ncbi:MAG: hypothetical protein KKA62_02065 [Nanoarchaeota archaeon]|nr:hypothetical protein [Nanoarchaeota archaeon]MBU1644094.1 hypothetical protein [Nanoarchaeota archaeon]MBU1976720.1 hypothetical protein [Nanoarchaeota archaeon]